MDAERTDATVSAVQKILEVFDESAIEKFAEEVTRQIATDEESFQKKGYQIMKAYLEGPETADNMLIALCGWSMKSLLVFAGLTLDDEGLLNNK